MTVKLLDQYNDKFTDNNVVFTERNDSASTIGGTPRYPTVASNGSFYISGDDFPTAPNDQDKVVSFDVKIRNLSTVVSFRAICFDRLCFY